MKKYLIDTNIMIAYFKQDIAIMEKFHTINDLYIPSITIGELYLGAHLSLKVEKNINNINNLLYQFKILNVTQNTAQNYGSIKATLRKTGKPIPENDIWIAAIAKEHDLIIATRDKHFLSLDFIQTESW